MSSYGDDYSDEERNFIEHAGASQGESDIEGESESEGEGVVEGGVDGTSGGGGGERVNGEGSAATGGEGSSGAVDRPDGDTHGASGSEGIGGVESNQDANEANGSGWDVRQNEAGDWNEGDVQAGNSWGTVRDSSGNTSGGEESKPVSRGYRNDSPAESLSMGNLTAEEFCERLKLFRSPDVTILVGPEEVVFTVPKDLLCQNSVFFDRAFNGKFKEGVEQAMRLPEDTVLAFQMMLQWIYTGNIAISKGWGAVYTGPETTGIYLDFFNLADKIDLLGPLTSIFEKFREHLKGPRSWRNRSDCTNMCGLDSNGSDGAGATLPCSCRGWGASPSAPHDMFCDFVYSNCPSKQAHIDILRDGIITSEHIHAAFELRPNHEVRKILSQACVTSYILSDTMNFEFRFTEELETVDGFCQALLKEVSRTIAKTSKVLDPLNNVTVNWPSGSRDTAHNGWGPC